MRIEQGLRALSDRTDDMDADLRSRVVSIEHKFLSYDGRMSAIEQWRAQLDIFNARRDEQFTNLMSKFIDVEKKIDGVSGAISKVLWLVVGSVVVVVVGFALKGGFNLPHSPG
jgi:hypothetical protein